MEDALIGSYFAFITLGTKQPNCSKLYHLAKHILWQLYGELRNRLCLVIATSLVDSY